MQNLDSITHFVEGNRHCEKAAAAVPLPPSLALCVLYRFFVLSGKSVQCRN